MCELCAYSSNVIQLKLMWFFISNREKYVLCLPTIFLKRKKKEKVFPFQIFDVPNFQAIFYYYLIYLMYWYQSINWDYKRLTIIMSYFFKLALKHFHSWATGDGGMKSPMDTAICLLVSVLPFLVRESFPHSLSTSFENKSYVL